MGEVSRSKKKAFREKVQECSLSPCYPGCGNSRWEIRFILSKEKKNKRRI